jgi:hypothetical protein
MLALAMEFSRVGSRTASRLPTSRASINDAPRAVVRAEVLCR